MNQLPNLLAPLRHSIYYTRSGFALVASNPGLFGAIVTYFSLPSAIAAILASQNFFGEWWQDALLFVLNSMTIVMGPVVFMLAVGAAFRGERPSLATVVVRAVTWLPRYGWTNTHTSVIFWVPVSALVTLQEWTVHQTGSVMAAWLPAGLLWGVVIIPLAVYLHSRTLLAPYLAVHSNLPGSQAAWLSWLLSGRYMPLAIATLVVASAPMAGPYLVAGALVLSQQPELLDRPRVLSPLLAIGIQLVRLTLIPAAYLMYHELWDAAESRLEDPKSAPALVRGLLALTAWVPPLGPLGRRQYSDAQLVRRG